MQYEHIQIDNETKTGRERVKEIEIVKGIIRKK